jgi:MFS family permease
MTSLPPPAEDAVYTKVTWRLLPFIGLCYMVAYLDRVNVGFAKLQMLNDLSLSEAAYGFGAGIFFIGYLLFELPSNLILHRVGARRWLARIMVTWGIISGLMAYTGPLASAVGVSNETMFYILRFLLGLAEAGFFPGLILYFNYWYPSQRQGRIVSYLLVAQPVSFILGGPLSGLIIDTLVGTAGMHGWQWMFIIEAVPAVVLGLVILRYLSDGIHDASWLTEGEKELLSSRIARENRMKSDYPLGKLLGIGMIWVFVLIYFLLVVGMYGVNFWLPSIIRSTGVQSALSIGLVTAIPYAFSVLFMLLASRHSERTDERRWHAAVAALIAGIGLICSAYFAGSTVLTLVFITLAISGGLTLNALFWAFPGAMLTGAAVAAGIATINSLGALGGFFGPSLLGVLTEKLGNTNAGLSVLGLCMIGAAVLVAVFCRNGHPAGSPSVAGGKAVG